MKIDAISSTIHQLFEKGYLTEKETTLLLSDLIVATNDVANIAGTYGCFLSKWSSASQNTLLMKSRKLRAKPIHYKTMNTDVFGISSAPNDIVYFDPPYTKRQYASYYHIPETIVLGDCPVVEGVSGLRPWKDRASVFCYKTKALNALVSLVTSQNAGCIYISYSDDGHIELSDLIKALEKTGEVTIYKLGTISRYNSHSNVKKTSSSVEEYLIKYARL